MWSICSGTLSDYYLTYRVVSKTGQNCSRREHMLSKDVEAKLFTVISFYHLKCKIIGYMGFILKKTH